MKEPHREREIKKGVALLAIKKRGDETALSDRSSD